MSYTIRPMSINEVVGFFYRNGDEGAARFITDDCRRNSAPELFQYKDDQVTVTGLKLLESNAARLKELAATNGDAVKALVTFAVRDRGALFQEAVSQRKPQAIEDTIDLLQHTYGWRTASLVNHGFFSERPRFDFTLEQLGAIKRSLGKLQANYGGSIAAENDRTAVEAKIAAAAQSALTRAFDAGGYGSQKNDPVEQFKILREIMSKDEADKCVREAVEGGLLEHALTANSDGLNKAEKVLAEAENAGMKQEDIFDLLTKGNMVGITLVDKTALGADAETLQFIVDKVRETGGAKADKFLNEFIGKRRAIFDDKIGYDLQDVYHKLDSKGPEYTKLTAIGPMSGYKNVAADLNAMNQLMLDVQPVVYDYLDKHPPKDKEKAEKLRKFADECGPVTAGPTIVGYARTASLKFFVDLQKQVAKLDNQQAADWLFGELSEIKDVAKGGTCMHRGWAGSTLLGPPGSANCVSTALPKFVATLDGIFGADVAVPLVKKLFALTNGHGLRPLDETLGAGPSDKYAGPYYEAIVQQLSATLKDPAKFTRYMDEAIVPNLPPAFVYGAPKNDPTSKYTGRRGGGKFDLDW